MKIMDKRVDAYIEAYNAKAIEAHNSIQDMDKKGFEGLSSSQIESKLEEIAFENLRQAIAAGIEASDAVRIEAAKLTFNAMFNVIESDVEEDKK